MTTLVRLYHPTDFAGRLICWRLESQFSHATIEINGTIYSATAPRIVAVGPRDPTFGMPPREGRTFELRLTPEQEAKAEAYCKSMVGSGYDILAMLGWAFRIRALQDRHRVYCFELVYDALAAAGAFLCSKRLVTGDQLLVDLFESGLVSSVPIECRYEAMSQKAPVLIRR